MAYGIDELIEQKTDAYRGNPAALEQRSKMSNELVDVLALQKLKSEHDTAKRELQLQIQTQPDTIAKQLEAEMVAEQKMTCYGVSLVCWPLIKHVNSNVWRL